MAESYFGEGLPENFYDRALAAGRGKASVFTDGIYGVASYPNIVAHLLKRGFSHEDVKKVMGGNFLRVFQETWKK